MKHTVCSIMLLLIPVAAVAGTATMDFDNGVGLLSWGGGALNTLDGRARFNVSGAAFLANDNTRIPAGGTVSATMRLTPAIDPGTSRVYVAMESVVDVLSVVWARCDRAGNATLMYNGGQQTTSFDNPSVANDMTLTYSASTGRATLAINGVARLSAENALCGAKSVYIGAMADAAASFDRFSVTGFSIPDYPAVANDSDHDSISNQQETAAGTNTADPGNRPVDGTAGAAIAATNGATLMFTPGSFSGTVNVAVATPGSIPAGTVPCGRELSTTAVELAPSGTSFLNPVHVTMSYTPGQIPNMEPSTLSPVYYTGTAYSDDGIADVVVDTIARTVSFTTTHFTLFVLAGGLMDADSDGTPDIDDTFPSNPNGQTDTDSDGIGDEWENTWFSNLTTAGEATDFDNDGLSDLREFEDWYFGLDPTDGSNPLPVAGSAACLGLAALVLAAAQRRIRA